MEFIFHYYEYINATFDLVIYTKTLTTSVSSKYLINKSTFWQSFSEDKLLKSILVLTYILTCDAVGFGFGPRLIIGTLFMSSNNRVLYLTFKWCFKLYFVKQVLWLLLRHNVIYMYVLSSRLWLNVLYTALLNQLFLTIGIVLQLIWKPLTLI